MIKQILIADDHSIVREGLKHIINQELNLNVSDEAQNGIEVLNKIKTNKYDLLILDISMPGENGMEVLKKVRRSVPELKVLMLSTYSDDIYADRSLKSGASGYLNKQNATKYLIIAINKILEGKKYISQSAIEDIDLSKINNYKNTIHNKLSSREMQVLILIGSGKTISRIGLELKLNVKTISTYRTRILKKLDLETTADLIKYSKTRLFLNNMI